MSGARGCRPGENVGGKGEWPVTDPHPLPKGCSAAPHRLASHLRRQMSRLPREQVRVMFFDRANRLLDDVVIVEGAADEVVLPLRRIVRLALNLEAAGLVLAHNHPSGNAEPSRADLTATRDLVDLCRRLEIAVLDHIVVARGGWTSLYLKGLM